MYGNEVNRDSVIPAGDRNAHEAEFDFQNGRYACSYRWPTQVHFVKVSDTQFVSTCFFL